MKRINLLGFQNGNDTRDYVVNLFDRGITGDEVIEPEDLNAHYGENYSTVVIADPEEDTYTFYSGRKKGEVLNGKNFYKKHKQYILDSSPIFSRRLGRDIREGLNSRPSLGRVNNKTLYNYLKGMYD